jgi:protein SCO1/2
LVLALGSRCSQPVDPAAAKERHVRTIVTSGGTPVELPPFMGKPLPAAAMQVALVDQRNEPCSLAAAAGKVRVVSFFYRCCSIMTMCPQLTAAVSDAGGRLTDEEKRAVSILLVSFDPERDTPERLAEYGKSIHADPTVIRLATGEVAAVKTLTEACGVQFAAEGGGEIGHNMRTVVLDGEGIVRKVFRGSEFETGDLLLAMREALAPAAVAK